MKKELLEFLNNKIYLSVVALSAVCAYGFAVTHYSIGMDDTAVSLYFEEGLAPYVGRWTLFFINRVLHIHIGDFAPWTVELISVLLLILSATIWCSLWKRICGPKVKLPVWGYAFAAGIFISCPLISEVFVFYLHNGVCTGYGVTALALWLFLDSLQKGKEKKRIAGEVALSSLLLCAALGFYESFVIVFIVGALMLFFLNRLLYGKNEESEYKRTFLPWAGRGIFVLASAMAERMLILEALKAIYHLDRLSVYNAQYRNFFGEIFINENEFQMILKRFFMKYYINALTYLPITVLVLSLACIGICALYFSIRRRDALLLICFAAMLLLPVMMSILEGWPTRYRSAQYVPVVCAFAVLLVFLFLYQNEKPLPVKAVWGILLGILLFNQCVEMNKWFYVDYLKYKDTEKVMRQIAYDLEKDFDTSKPVIFRGAYEVPYEIAKEAYTGFDSWQFKAVSFLTDWFDEHLKEKYYATDDFAYVSAEMPALSTLQWGVTAFDGTSRQLINFWNMHGIDGFSCVTDLELIEEAEQIRNDTDMPPYPKAGYIMECDEYIIINLSK